MLRATVREVDAKGFALDDEESACGMRCVAVPLRDADGTTIAAISASGRADRLTLERVEAVCEVLKEAATELGVSQTQMKRICRAHNIRRWPYRKVRIEFLNLFIRPDSLGVVGPGFTYFFYF